MPEPGQSVWPVRTLQRSGLVSCDVRMCQDQVAAGAEMPKEGHPYHPRVSRRRRDTESNDKGSAQVLFNKEQRFH